MLKGFSALSTLAPLAARLLRQSARRALARLVPAVWDRSRPVYPHPVPAPGNRQKWLSGLVSEGAVFEDAAAVAAWGHM